MGKYIFSRKNSRLYVTNESWKGEGLGNKYPIFVQGRAWLHFFKKLITMEWHWSKRFSIALNFEYGDHYEQEYDWGFHFAFLFLSFWFHFTMDEEKGYKNRCEKKSRRYGFDVYYSGEVYLCLEWHWNETGEWYSDKAKMKGRGIHKLINLTDIVLGRSKYSEQILDARDGEVSMPEGSYPVRMEKKIQVWKRPRWFAKKKDTIHVEVKDNGSIPVPGKGESDWDCGEDGICSTGFETSSYQDAINKFRAAAFETRTRYGGANWLPERASA